MPQGNDLGLLSDGRNSLNNRASLAARSHDHEIDRSDCGSVKTGAPRIGIVLAQPRRQSSRIGGVGMAES